MYCMAILMPPLQSYSEQIRQCEYITLHTTWRHFSRKKCPIQLEVRSKVFLWSFRSIFDPQSFIVPNLIEWQATINSQVLLSAEFPPSHPIMLSSRGWITWHLPLLSFACQLFPRLLNAGPLTSQYSKHLTAEKYFALSVRMTSSGSPRSNLMPVIVGALKTNPISGSRRFVLKT